MRRVDFVYCCILSTRLSSISVIGFGSDWATAGEHGPAAMGAGTGRVAAAGWAREVAAAALANSTRAAAATDVGGLTCLVGLVLYSVGTAAAVVLVAPKRRRATPTSRGGARRGEGPRRASL